MTPASGTRLGPYEIVSALGVGGMGEVYRARDTCLERDVAIRDSCVVSSITMTPPEPAIERRPPSSRRTLE